MTRIAGSRRPSRGRTWASRGVLLAVLVAAGCCSTKSDGAEWIARAEAANRTADGLLAAGNAAGARDALSDALDARAATTPNSAGERAVREDLSYRLAELELGQGHVKDAVARATQGLDAGRTNDVFTTNLLIVRGRALEQLGDAVAASRDYHDALIIMEALLDRSMEGKSR